MPGAFDPYHRWLGIPPEKQPANLYGLLGIEPFENNPDVIESAADQRMAHLRTFQAGGHGELSQKLLNEVAAAKVRLLDPRKKATYDAKLRKEFEARKVLLPRAIPVTSAAPEKPSAAAASRRPQNLPVILAAVAAGVVVLLILIGWLASLRSGQTADRGDDQQQQEEKSTQPPVVPEKTRLAVPSAEDQAAVLEKLKEVYELDKQRTIDEKLALAGEMLTLAERSRGRPTERFVVLRKVMELASEGGDAASAFEAIDRIAADFEIDALTVKAKVLPNVTAAAGDAEKLGWLTEAGLALVDEAAGRSQYDVANAIIETVHRACLGPAGRDYRKRLYDRRMEIERLYRLWQEFDEALSKLELTPDDPEANLAVGRWYCLRQNDWPQGLPHLAKGSDPALRAAAEDEVTLTPTDPAAQVRLADKWWDLAEAAEDEAKAALMHHAGTWYRKAKPGVQTSLEKIELDRRLAEIAKLDQPGPIVATHPPQPEPREPPEPPKDPGTPVATNTGGGRPLLAPATGVPRRPMLKRFDPATAQPVRVLQGKTGSINDMVFSPDGSVLISVDAQKNLAFWDVAAGQLRGMFAASSEGLRCVAVSPNGALVAVAGRESTIRLWDTTKGQLKAELVGHTSEILSLDFSPDGARLASGSDDQTLRIWDLATGRLQRTLEGHGRRIRCVRFSPDGSMLASACLDGSFGLWDPATGELRRQQKVGPEVRWVAFSPDGSILAFSAGSHKIQLWWSPPARGGP